MRQTIRQLAIDLLGLAKAYPTAMTDPAELSALLRKLHPRIPGTPLVRLGPAEDGGYLVPDDLDGIEACFSPGVNTESGFEKSCADRGMKVFLADASVDGPAESNPRFHFTKKYLGVVPSNDFMTMQDWVNAALPGSTSDLLLQIDIEGYEYEVFLSMADDLMRRFRIIVAEFHGLDHYWSKPFFKLASRTYEKILHTHTCVHIHPNTYCGSLKKSGLEMPRGMEFTFLRNDRELMPAFASTFPHPLDCDNTMKETLILPPCWIRSE